jgi:hypothetical protein
MPTDPEVNRISKGWLTHTRMCRNLEKSLRVPPMGATLSGLQKTFEFSAACLNGLADFCFGAELTGLRVTFCECGRRHSKD